LIADGPAGPVAFSHAKQNTVLTDWVEASTASWQFKDVRVTVVSATVGPIDVMGPKDFKAKSKEPYLELVLRVANIGVERPLELAGWSVGQGIEQVQLTDSAGRTLKPASYEEGWVPDLPAPKPLQKLFPGKVADARLIFSAPQPKTDYLRLVLPATTFGFQEEIKFQIPGSWLIPTASLKK
jgi:hypothetical protein